MFKVKILLNGIVLSRFSDYFGLYYCIGVNSNPIWKSQIYW